MKRSKYWKLTVDDADTRTARKRRPSLRARLIRRVKRLPGLERLIRGGR